MLSLIISDIKKRLSTDNLFDLVGPAGFESRNFENLRFSQISWTHEKSAIQIYKTFFLYFEGLRFFGASDPPQYFKPG